MNRLKEELRNKIEAIMDNETVALTKTGDKDFNPPEIVNFDTVVLNKYEAVNKLLEFINQNYISKEQILNLECLKDEKISKELETQAKELEKMNEYCVSADEILEDIGEKYNERNQLRKEIIEAINNLKEEI